MPTDRDLVKSLGSDVCPACTGHKSRSQTFCRGCYFKLSKTARNRLYDRLGAGYAEAVDAAMRALGRSEFRMSDE